MIERRRALFIFPTDAMGGAERVTRMLAGEAVRSAELDQVDCLVLAGRATGSLNNLEGQYGVSLHYLGSSRAIFGLLRLALFLFRRPYSLVFSSHLHVNALCSLLRRIGWLSTESLVSRESTTVSERDFGMRSPLIRSLHRLYGSQDLIVCQTDFMRLALEQASSGRLSEKLETLANPIDLEWISECVKLPPPVAVDAIPASRKIVVWCGRLFAVKAPLLAIDTFAAIYDSGAIDVHLVMVGDGPLRSAVETRVIERGLKGRVTLTGHLDTPAAVMSRAKVGLVTSRTEGFPNVVLEMLGSGVAAIVTTPCTPALDTVPGIEVQPARPLALAGACRRLLEDALPPRAVAEYLRERDSRSYFRKLYSSMSVRKAGPVPQQPTSRS